MRFVILVATALALSGCAARSPRPSTTVSKDTTSPTGLGALSAPNADPFPSTYVRFPSAPVVLRNVNIMTAAGPTIRNGMVSLAEGKIVAVGGSVAIPAGAIVIDGAGKWVTPGLIDTHGHVGAGGAPSTQANSDINEATNPVTAQVWV